MGHPTALSIRNRALAGAAIVVAVALSASPIRAASLVPEGRPAPDFQLTTLAGQTVHLADEQGHPVVLLFGELYNRNSVSAARDAAAVLARPALAGLGATAYFLMTETGSDAKRQADARTRGITLPILRDPGRRTFASYRVYVLPSLIVLDAKGVTVLASAGYPLDFRDTLADAILLAGGKLSADQFARNRAPATQPAALGDHVRAVRLAALGEQLARRGSTELAMTHFRDALALNADCLPAHIGLGNCLLNRRELARAERHFLAALGGRPDSVDAALGLIHVQLVRGGPELTDADARLRKLQAAHRDDPKVIYLAGLVAERTGDTATAMGRYRRAAELLLYGRPQKGVPK